MGNELLYQRDLKRWYPLIDHPVQLALINDDVRFKVVPAGRRSGKTERAKRFIAKKMLSESNKSYFIAAPTRSQVEKIYWQDMKQLCFTSLLNTKGVYESKLVIQLPNGNSLTLVGLDKPERIEGVQWDGGIVDEIADIKSDAWEKNIAPALDTVNPLQPDYRAWAWLIGVPEGLNHYYELSEYARTSGDPDWRLYTWKSSEILPSALIDAIKQRISLKAYKQEYEASFETATRRIYEDYSERNHTNETIKEHEQLLWFHDFNYTPLSSGIGVIRDKNDFYILDEIVLTSAVASQSALEFIEKYKNHKNKNVIIFGDPAGKAGEKHGHTSDYTAIEQILRQNGWQFKRQVKAAAPAIKDRQNAVRAKICNAHNEVSLFVNANKAPYVHKGLATTQVKSGSTFLEENSEYQHITTAIGYCIDRIFPVTFMESEVHVHPQPTFNYW